MPLVSNSVRRELQRTMTEDAGVLRSAGSLRDARVRLAAMEADGASCTEDWETTNLHALASVLVSHALEREETRGSHWREDFPDRNDVKWRVHLVSRVDPDGQLRTRRESVRA